MQAGVPVITMDFPEYKALNNIHEVAVLLPALQPEKIAAVVLQLAADEHAYQQLSAHCAAAAKGWNWENEKITLLEVWKNALKEK